MNSSNTPKIRIKNLYKVLEKTKQKTIQPPPDFSSVCMFTQLWDSLDP